MTEQELRAQECREWLEFAQADLDSARCLHEGPLHPKPLSIICYHCQQAAEKAVKAVIVHLGGQGGVPKVHDIGFLLRQIRNRLKTAGHPITDDLMDRAEALTRYGVAPRYPGELRPDEPETRRALKDAETLLNWAENIINNIN